MEKILLFSDINRCPPCRSFKAWLDNYENWQDKIEYINISDYHLASSLINKYNVPGFRKIPFMYYQGYLFNSINGNPHEYKEYLKKILL